MQVLFIKSTTTFHSAGDIAFVLLQPFSDKCLNVFNQKGTPCSEGLERNHRTWIWTRTLRSSLSPVPTRHRIITEGTMAKRTATYNRWKLVQWTLYQILSGIKCCNGWWHTYLLFLKLMYDQHSRPGTHLVARMMISVLVGVTRTSTPE